MANLHALLAERCLGQSPGRILLEDKISFQLTSQRMTEQAARQMEIFSYDLDAPLYDQIPFLQALKSLVLQSRFSRLRILLQNNERVRKQGHRLLELSRRLPSRIEIRRPHPEHIDHLENFLVIDRTGYVRRPIHNRYEGEADFGAPSEAVKLSDFFADIWECSEPDNQLRLLHL